MESPGEPSWVIPCWAPFERILGAACVAKLAFGGFKCAPMWLQRCPKVVPKSSMVASRVPNILHGGLREGGPPKPSQRARGPGDATSTAWPRAIVFLLVWNSKNSKIDSKIDNNNEFHQNMLQSILTGYIQYLKRVGIPEIHRF
jgi:hypothetical protein